MFEYWFFFEYLNIRLVRSYINWCDFVFFIKKGLCVDCVYFEDYEEMYRNIINKVGKFFER